MTQYFDSGLYEHAFYTKHEIDFDSDKTAYEDIEYSSELLGEHYKRDIGLEYSDEDDQWEQVREMFWDNVSCCPICFEPLIFNEEIALECFLTPFTFKEKGMLALPGYGIELTPRLEAYQTLVHNTIDRKSRFFSSGADDYFESALVGKEVSKKVLQAINSTLRQEN